MVKNALRRSVNRLGYHKTAAIVQGMYEDDLITLRIAATLMQYLNRWYAEQYRYEKPNQLRVY